MTRATTSILLIVLLAAAAAGGFVWGFLAHKKGIFPFALLRSVGRQVGLEPAGPMNVRARSADVAMLTALPYVSGTLDVDSGSRGVLIHDREKAQPGVNFYVGYETGTAELIDMDGEALYRWTFPTPHFIHAELLPDGDLVAMRRNQRVVRMNKDSEVLWSFPLDAHHDLWIEDGRIYVQANEERLVPEIHPSLPVLDDVIVVLSMDGEEIGNRLSLVDAVLDSPYAFILPSVSHLDFESARRRGDRFALDILHNNHVAVFDGRLADRSELYRAGNLLVSMCHVHAVAMLDGESHDVLWLWGPGNLTLQHHPVLLENGNVMIFNNGTEASQILEVDPLTNDVVWLYEDPEFFTRTRGSHQRLDNGNTLITETDSGYVFEVTADGEKVWEFANPDVDPQGVRTHIWRMLRFDPATLTFLEGRG